MGIPDSPTSLSPPPQDLNPSIEEGVPQDEIRRALEQQPAANPPGGPPSHVMEAEALKKRIGTVFLIIKGRKSGENVLRRLFADLKLETASPQKLQQIGQILDGLLRDDTLRFGNRDPRFNLNRELLVRISDWERDQ